ncbi:MAG: Rieske (2Fe-2S) protein [Rhodanobacter sp.]|nr:MAG: Rieske (2Fe-2S) protein [Rhodanobacter sp.]TAL92114.1 MAG: Rieske (2Fe-2S) protein [Rhodanobacter sp.]TAM38798.1 MAG: Rieske (2Fe-2S) protein [Rhodanobacter sp.]
MIDQTHDDACSCCTNGEVDNDRRNVLKGTLALTLASLATASLPVLGQSAPKRRPKAGDRLAFAIGERKDQEIKLADLELGGAPTLAYPRDPETGEVLASRVNMLVVIRLDPKVIEPSSAHNAAGGVVAFSAVCTHRGCVITALVPGQSNLVCNCHGSEYSVANDGAIVRGPTTRRLAMLPLEIKEGALMVAGMFDGPLGPPA